MTIGERIKIYRKEKGYTLKQLSEISKLSTSFISDIEHGRSNPGVENLSQLAKALNVTTDEILGNSTISQSQQKPYIDLFPGVGSLPKDILVKQLESLLPPEEKEALITARKNKYSDMFTRNPKQDMPVPSALPALTPKDERDVAKDLQKILFNLDSDAGLAFYEGEPMSEESKEILRISIENSMRLAKQMAKKKYTPKKYRK